MHIPINYEGAFIHSPLLRCEFNVSALSKISLHMQRYSLGERLRFEAAAIITV
jgi:hypothetical protein